MTIIGVVAASFPSSTHVRKVKIMRIDGVDDFINIMGIDVLHNGVNQRALSGTIMPPFPAPLTTPWETLNDGDVHTISHTGASAAAYVELDFGTNGVPCDTIRVVNRDDCCQDRLKGTVLIATGLEREIILFQPLGSDMVYTFAIPATAVELGASLDIGVWPPMGHFGDQSARWIWSDASAIASSVSRTVTFTRSFWSPDPLTAEWHMIVDESADIYLNDQFVDHGWGGWWGAKYPTGTAAVAAGWNRIRIVATNTEGPGGLVFALMNGDSLIVHSDRTWNITDIHPDVI